MTHRNRLIFILLLILISGSMLSQNLIFRAVEFMGVPDSDKATFLKMIPFKPDEAVDRKVFNDTVDSIKKKIQSKKGIKHVFVSPILITTTRGYMKSGIYLTFDVVKDYSPAFKAIRKRPAQKIELNQEIQLSVKRYLVESKKAELRGKKDRLSKGIPLLNDKSQLFLASDLRSFSDGEPETLQRILLNAFDYEQRLFALEIVAKGSDITGKIKLLVEMLKDPDSEVRTLAAERLMPLLIHARTIGLDTTGIEPYINLMSLPTVSDRTNGAKLIQAWMTNHKHKYEYIRKVAGKWLVKLALSKQPDNFTVARNIIKRISGFDYSGHPDGWSAWIVDLQSSNSKN